MGNLEWTSDLSVGYSEIDQQHQKLIEIINNLYSAMKVGKGKEASGKILKELVDYTSYHFGTEEKLMEEFNYPEKENHKQVHQALVAKVVDFQNKFLNGEIGVTVELFKFLNDWLVDHIIGTDKKLGGFLKTKKIK